MSLDLDREIERDHRKQAFLRDNGKCRYCGLDALSSLSLFWSFEFDHVVAQSENGPDTLDNIVLCCKACNGALSRAGHLKTVDERKKYVESQIPSRSEIYEAWKKKLRP